MVKNNKTAKNNKNEEIEYSFEVKKALQFKKSKNIVFDLVVNGITLYDLSIIEGTNKKGDYKFIAFPNHKGSDGNYYHYCWFPIDDDLQDEIIKAVEKEL